MSQPDPSLEQVQRWMLAVIMHPAGIQAGLASAEARAELDVAEEQLETLVGPSRHRTSIERLRVYGNAYYARLLECMGELFPALRHALGSELFDRFTFEYLQRYPPSSYTLEHLPDHFVQFLEETQPDAAADDGCNPTSWADFFVDLARLEQAIDRVFHGPGTEEQPVRTLDCLRQISPEDWPATVLSPAVCLRLLTFRYPVNDYYTAFRATGSPCVPAPAASYLALYRRAYVVRRMPLSGTQHDLLSRLCAGQCVGDAIASWAEACDEPTSAEELQSWFAIWAAEEVVMLQEEGRRMKAEG